jgi:hypothetical protein
VTVTFLDFLPFLPASLVALMLSAKSHTYVKSCQYVASTATSCDWLMI